MKQAEHLRAGCVLLRLNDRILLIVCVVSEFALCVLSAVG